METEDHLRLFMLQQLKNAIKTYNERHRTDEGLSAVYDISKKLKIDLAKATSLELEHISSILSSK